MNIKALVPLILAVVLGLVAAFAGWRVMQQPATHAVGPEGVKLLVVKSDVEPGVALGADQLTYATLGTPTAPQGTFTDIDQLAGRVPVTPLRRGQVVYESMLATQGAGVGLQALVPPGMRAITVEVNEFSGVGHLLVPGSRVDVVVTMPVEQGNGLMTRTVCQDLKVTAVGRQLSVKTDQNKDKDDERAAPSVTLLATPKDVQLIELAASTGRPRLVLRSNTDEARTTLPGVTLAELRGPSTHTPQPPVRQAAQDGPSTRPSDAPSHRVLATVPTSAVRTVQIIRGGHESTVTFPDDASSALTQLPVEP